MTLIIAAVAVAAMFVSSCLQPGEYDPTGNEPIGRLDVVRTMGSAIRVKGWAIDPNTTAPIKVTVAYVGLNQKVLANVDRPDVAAAYPGYGSAHGFDFTTPSLGSGVGQVCVGIDNVGAGSRGRILGCRDIALGADDTLGALTDVTATSSTSVRVVGWALDPDTDSSIWIKLQLNSGAWNYYPADRPLADINRFFGVDNHHGFALDFPVTPGINKVCVQVDAYGRGKAADLGCRSVANESVTPVGTGYDLQTVSRVKPPAGHPLETIERDAGVSTTLSDGSVMWFFGDSGQVDSNGTLKYFVNNTAAWASAAKPTVTLDAVQSGVVSPYQSMTPIQSFLTACPANWNSVLWPASAVTVKQSATVDRVLVYFANVCLGGDMLMAGRGMGVASFTYNTAAPPNQSPIIGQIITQTLFGTARPYGTAATYDGQHVYVYQCSTPENDGQIHWPSDPAYGPCTVARVGASAVGDISKYRYYAGDSTWSDQQTDAVAMTVPTTAQSGPDQDKQLPPSAFTIVDDPVHGYLMVYTPWPGLSDRVAVRRASSPTGPWSNRVEYKVPGCFDSAGGKEKYCYAATAQPALSKPGAIGIGYYDQLVGLTPARAGYLAGTFFTAW